MKPELKSDEVLEFKILEEIGQGKSFTQRDLSKKFNIALGLSNAYIRRLIEKGYVMVSTMPRKRVFYNLTPKGILEKSRLTLMYMRDSFEYYRFLRKSIQQTLDSLVQSGVRRVVIFGTGEIAEIVFIMLRQSGMQPWSVVEFEPKKTHFLGLEVCGADRLNKDDFDVIIVAEEIYEDSSHLAKAIREMNLPVEKMLLFTGHRLSMEDDLKILPPAFAETQKS